MCNTNKSILTDFDDFKEELGPSREASLKRDMSLDVQYDEQDLMKVSVVFGDTPPLYPAC